VHLVTAADGASDFYEFENEARYDTLESAKLTDKKLRQAYYDHHKWLMIENIPGSGFDEKMTRTKEAVYSILGINTGASFFKKFLLKKQPNQNKNNSEVPIDLSSFPDFE